MAGEAAQHEFKNHMVSTHSHPKVAGDGLIAAGLIEEQHGFNTQPPEGGWGFQSVCQFVGISRFNTQPPEGGWIG